MKTISRSRQKHNATQEWRVGFTLTEMLVAGGIVVVLAALLFPSAKVALDHSKTAKCISNLRSIGGALIAYAGENNGYLLPRALKDSSGPERYWHARLLNQGYLDNPEVFYCPSMTPYSYKQSTNAAYNVYKSTGQTYGMRLWVAPGRSWSMTEDPQPLSSIETPSTFFLVADSYWDAWGAQGYTIAPGASGQRAHLRHSKMANALFADGHVEPKNADYFTNDVPKNQGAYGKSSPIPIWPQE